MTLDERIRLFAALGEWLLRYREDSADRDLAPLREAARLAEAENPWFTQDHIRYALNSIGRSLSHANLDTWMGRYREPAVAPREPETVGVVMAGNIPAVGFHDFLSVLITGNRVLAKLSSADARLIPAMAEFLMGNCPEWKERITFTSGRLDGFHSIIATGSDNTARHFDYYFSKHPHIIRRNRNSIAILRGNETGDALNGLAGDIMLYFGRGCRSVSKLFIPPGYDLSPFISALGRYTHFLDHNKYRNNIDYNRTLLLMNLEPFIDAGCLLLRQEPSIGSRIGVLHYQEYRADSEVLQWISANRDRIQCVVGDDLPGIATVPFGESQRPALWDYADDVDTVRFLIS